MSTCNYDPEKKAVSNWLPAVISGRCGGELVVVPFRLGISATIPPTKLYKFEFGDFIRVRIRLKLDPTPETPHLRHEVVDARGCRISEWPPMRIEGSGARQALLIQARAKFQNTVPYDERKIVLLENAQFGIIVDLHGHLPLSKAVGMETALVEFKVATSPLDATKSIFTVTNVLDVTMKPACTNVDTVSSKVESTVPKVESTILPLMSLPSVGFVGYLVPDMNGFIWSRSYDIDVELRKPFVLEAELGKWVEFKAEFSRGARRAHVCAPIRVIDDVLPTRMLNGIPEIRGECVYLGTDKCGHANLWNVIVGEVIDLHGYLPLNTPLRHTFTVWMVRHSSDTHSHRWKISKMETTPPELKQLRGSIPMASDYPDDVLDQVVSGRSSTNGIERPGLVLGSRERRLSGKQARSPSSLHSETMSSMASEMAALSACDNHRRSMDDTGRITTSSPAKRLEEYEKMSLLDMMCVLLDNPAIAATIEQEDVAAFVRINNLVFEE